MLADVFIRRPVLATVCSLLIILAGAVSIPTLPIARYPDLAPPSLTVNAVYTGANAQSVESAVTTPLEQAINGVEGMTYITSSSTNSGFSTINVTFDIDRNIDLAAVDVQNRVNQALGRMPAEVRTNGINVVKNTAGFMGGTQTVNALRVHFRNWVMEGTRPPPSTYPTLKGRRVDGASDDDADDDRDDDDEDRDDERDDDRRMARRIPDLVPANKAAMGFPTLPGLRATAPEAGFINPVLDYDWGPLFNYTDASGIPTHVPPPIKRVIKMLVPRVDADGNEVGGVPTVLTDAPLGTYLGWNITTDQPVAGVVRPFHKGQLCNYVGGMIPFAKTRAERVQTGDPRLSLEERYGNHDGYVAAVRKAAAHAIAKGFLLQADADALIALAQASNVLP